MKNRCFCRSRSSGYGSLNQLEPSSAAYHLPGAIRLRGNLDTDALEQSLREIVRRHEVLRTTFEMRDGQPVQVVNAVEDVRMERLDLSQLELARREAQLQLIIGEEIVRPFDLSRGPLLVRASCVKLADDEHLLVVVMHHIVADGWSLGVLVGELSRLYEAFRMGTPSPLPELEIQYADYAQWQRSVVAGIGRWKNTSLTGAGGWRVRRRYWNCRLTARVHPRRAIAVDDTYSRSRRTLTVASEN